MNNLLNQIDVRIRDRMQFVLVGCVQGELFPHQVLQRAIETLDDRRFHRAVRRVVVDSARRDASLKLRVVELLSHVGL